MGHTEEVERKYYLGQVRDEDMDRITGLNGQDAQKQRPLSFSSSAVFFTCLTAPPGIRTPDPLIKSRESDGLKPLVRAESPGEKGTACECPEGHEATENRGDSVPIGIPQELAEVSGGAVEVSSGGRRSDKQNDKQNDKRALVHPDLAKVIDAWPDLSEPVKAAILAMVQAAAQPKGKSARRRKE